MAEKKTAIVSHMKKKSFPERTLSKIEKKYPHVKASNLDEKSNIVDRPPKR